MLFFGKITKFSFLPVSLAGHTKYLTNVIDGLFYRVQILISDFFTQFSALATIPSIIFSVDASPETQHS